MGGFSPNPIITLAVKKEIDEKILEPIINGFKKENLDFKGILFIGLMIDNGVPKMLEFNVRFGDPETQSVLPRLKTDLVENLDACIEGRFSEINIEWDERQSVTLVMSSKGYTETSHKGDIIKGLGKMNEKTYLFHAGTRKIGDRIKTDGGCVLAITSLASSLDEDRANVYEEIKKISFYGMQFRNDIGK